MLRAAWVLVGTVLVGLAFADSAPASDLKKSLRQCNGEEKDVTPEERLKGCSFVLKFGSENVTFLRNGYINRAYIYLGMGKKDLALADLTKAVELNTRHAHVFHNRGTIYLEKEAWDAAIADFDEAIRIDPNMSEAYYNRAVAHVGKGDLAQADADRVQAFKLNPELREAAN
jgi:tetratricopeptide (TPR) repeat protein